MALRVVVANPTSGKKIDAYALQIIASFQPDVLKAPAAFDIESFFEFDLEDICGVETGYGKLPNSINGYTNSDEKISIISVELMENGSQIKFTRSTMAHETGHALKHVSEFRKKKAILRSIHDSKHANLRLYRQDEIPVYRNPEWQAWRFAGALLMPETTFVPLIKKGFDEYELSEIYQVNSVFIRTRMRALKLI